MAAVNTAKVTDRRALRYANIEELLSDVDKIMAADQRGTLRRTGNWTAGQAMGHLAAWINFAWEGYPISPPWFIRPLLRLKKKKYLRSGMDAGIRIPGLTDGTVATEVLATPEAAGRLRQALARLASEEPRHHSPAWGPMPREDRIAMNLRHAELHLSFFHPQ